MKIRISKALNKKQVSDHAQKANPPLFEAKLR